jgi:hypothetical protein
MGRSGWRSVARFDEKNSTDEIVVTPEMIEAGVAVIYSDFLIDIGPTATAEMVESILRAALAEARCDRKDAVVG